MSTQKCSKCGRTLPFSAFHKDSKKTTGHCSWCKFCKAAHKVEQKHACVEYNLEYLSKHPCVDCNEDDCRALTYDHVRGKQHSVTDLIHNGNLEKLKEELKLCVVRCSSCHAVKTAREGNYYTHQYVMKQLEERKKEENND